MAKQEKITPQQAVEAVLGLVNMIDTASLAKLIKLDEIDGLKTGLEEVKAQIKAFDTTLSQPVKIEDPVLIENGPATRNHCVQFAYIQPETPTRFSNAWKKISPVLSQTSRISRPNWMR